jgi:hypothetical protein
MIGDATGAAPSCRGGQEDDMTSAFERIAPLAALVARELGLDRPARRATFRGEAPFCRTTAARLVAILRRTWRAASWR